MPSICIGIHVHAEPNRLLATLGCLRANTNLAAEVLLLPDGPDAAVRAALASLRDLPQLGTAAALGLPACFNRLAAATQADVLVLLESGAQVGPDWLDHLIAALAADPRNGLAGPSTNRAWNEQAAFPRAGDTPAEVARTAAEAARRFGAATRTLEPLHSLADFCYAVRREVVAAIGAADEAYGLGPCWEMDYNIRAARAGFRGVWACAAYVHRAPFSARRQREEVLRFESSKQRYQDKFCALRLRGARPDYEPHCSGEECEHFAPIALIQVRMPGPVANPALAVTDRTAVGATAQGERTMNLGSDRELSPTATAVPLPGAEQAICTPLVSCIMPSCGRGDFVLQSIQYFMRQDYPARELIIVDDGADNLTGRLSDDPCIRYVRMQPGQSIGAKRNYACELARGDFIAHWDDDDWYAPARLSTQIAPLCAGKADITGLTAALFFDLPGWKFWSCTADLHRNLFVADVHGGTLTYRRQVWRQLARYPNRSLAEDAAFLAQAIRRGARLHRLPGDDLFIYLRHAANSWRFECGQHLDPQGWRRTLEPALPPEDRAFYARYSTPMPAALPARAPEHLVQNQPLVSCIMLTANRRPLVPHAIMYFLRQDYPNRELIVVDDGADAIEDLIPPDPRIRYLRLASRQTIGAKRNLACAQARGEIIAHWDDDDWMANWRLSYQVTALLDQSADVCGLDHLLYYDVSSDQSWQYIYPPGSRRWVAGNTLCYAQRLWRDNRFPNAQVGEDTMFLWSSRAKRIIALPDDTFYVALIHAGNTSPKQTRSPCWHIYPTDAIRNLLGEDWAYYIDMARPHQPEA